MFEVTDCKILTMSSKRFITHKGSKIFEIIQFFDFDPFKKYSAVILNDLK